MNLQNSGLIILGHGSRAPEAAETLAKVTGMVREKTKYERVDYASLQLSEPDLPAVVREQVKAGIKSITVVPFLIAVGQHVKEDIPEALVALSDEFPGVSMRLGKPLGPDPRLADILAERAAETEREK